MYSFFVHGEGEEEEEDEESEEDKMIKEFVRDIKNGWVGCPQSNSTTLIVICNQLITITIILLLSPALV